MLREDTNAKPIMNEAISVNKIKLTGQGLDERGLACTIGTDKSNPSLKVDVNVNAIENDRLIIVTEMCLVQSAQRWGNLLRIWEHEDTGWVLDDIGNDIDSLNCLDTRLDQGGTLGVVTELVDELLDMADFVHLAFTGLLGVLVFLGFGLFELREISFVVIELLALEVDDLIASGVEEVTGVRHDNNCSLSQLLNVVFEPNQSWQIQMIGWLIEKQDLWFREDDLRDGNSHSPTT